MKRESKPIRYTPDFMSKFPYIALGDISDKDMPSEEEMSKYYGGKLTATIAGRVENKYTLLSFMANDLRITEDRLRELCAKVDISIQRIIFQLEDGVDSDVHEYVPDLAIILIAQQMDREAKGEC